jgi:lipopolysaccharide/colanic/teichoic acid biosynthesis glycosyltransferase
LGYLFTVWVFPLPPLKRLFDIVVSSAALLWAAPLILVCAALIVLWDRQSPVFAAQRMKTAQTRFVMWKLRTMRGVDDGLPTGGSKACRTTGLGRTLRKWHLDELPQLWNVLVGDMTLVGPRPPTAHAVSQYPEDFAHILQMRPGMTGLATVAMGREERHALAAVSTLAEVEHVYMTHVLPCKLKIERQYLETWSMGLDLWILFRTLGVILSLQAPALRAADPNWDGNEAGLRRVHATIRAPHL